ncbi:MAG: apolipoprotein N-acyltransferase [Chlorobiaceae bacterium]|nr:apolipoprotein N-acyltransferase [Chlorobiaceae bacterium]
MISFLRSAAMGNGSRYYGPLLSGVLLGISFPTYPFVRLEILAWIALVPLLISLRTVEKAGDLFRRVYLCMVVFCIISLWWVSLATLPGGILTILIQSFFLTIPLIVFFAFKKMAGYFFALVSLPFLWVAWEWAYMQQDLSLGWLTLGNSQANLNLMIQYADITGVWGVSFWLLLFNVLSVLAITGESKERVRFLAAMSVMVVLPLLYAAMVFQTDAVASGEERHMRVTLVQPNIDPYKKWERYNSTDIMERYYRITDRAVRENRPELVIWPETAIPFYILDSTYENDLKSLHGFLRKWDTALLSGFSDVLYYPSGSHRDPDNPIAAGGLRNGSFETFNASMLLLPGRNDPQVYHKMRLVPFAERVPYVDYLPWLEKLNFSLAGLKSWGKGTDTTIMQLESPRYGKVLTADVICYESIFPGLVSEFVLKGARFLTLVTNDGWYSTSYGPYQHLAIGRMRCIENRRALARCANTGLTEFIDKFGRTISSMPWWQEGTLTAEVPLESRMSFYTLHPDLFPKILVVICLLLLAAALTGRFRKT